MSNNQITNTKSKLLIEKAKVKAEVEVNVGTEHCSVPTEALALIFIIKLLPA